MRRSNMPHMLKESSSGLVCLRGCSRTAAITITCLYTAGSSIRESPTSACQHVNLHKCIYHATCMLHGKCICTCCSCLSRQRKQEADISAFHCNEELLCAHLHCCLYFVAFNYFLLRESCVKVWKACLETMISFFFKIRITNINIAKREPTMRNLSSGMFFLHSALKVSHNLQVTWAKNSALVVTFLLCWFCQWRVLKTWDC